MSERGSSRVPTHQSRTRDSYDAVSETYAQLLHDELGDKPLDRALLSTFAELVLRTGVTTVVDAGCGPGRITDVLHRLDLDASGFDLSPRMIDVARTTYPHLRFDVGDIARCRDLDASLSGVVAWYSTIHTPPGELAAVLDEFRRVLRVGGWLLMAFQVGDGHVHRSVAYGHDVDLDNYFRDLGNVTQMLERAGFHVWARLEREPEPPEKSRQAYVLARAQ
jgi:SAM-dependent methyltransferase